MQDEAKEIMARLAFFRREFAKFNDEFRVLGNHLNHAKNKHDELKNVSGRLADRLEIEVPVQQPLLEPPDDESAVPEPLRPANRRRRDLGSQIEDKQKAPCQGPSLFPLCDAN